MAGRRLGQVVFIAWAFRPQVPRGVRENETRVGPNMGPKLFQNCFRQAADDVGGGLVGLLGPLGVAPQKHRRIVTAPIGNHMHRNSSIK